MLRLGFTALAFFLLLCIGASTDAQRGVPTLPKAAPPKNLCPIGGTHCPAGREGPGGCWYGRSSYCSQGRVCPSELAICPRGGTGAGGCYAAARGGSCDDGLICFSMSTCRAGRLGRGGCYARDYYACTEGKLIPLRR